MPLTRKQKQKIISELSDKIAKKKIIIFTDYKGLPVSALRELKLRLKKADAEYKITKKTLLQIALKEQDIYVDVLDLEGQLGIAFGYGDEITPAKILREFSKEKDQLKILGGIMDSKFISDVEVITLAQILSKDQLFAQLVYGIKSPISGFVNILSANLRNLVLVLNRIANK